MFPKVASRGAVSCMEPLDKKIDEASILYGFTRFCQRNGYRIGERGGHKIVISTWYRWTTHESEGLAGKDNFGTTREM